MVNPTLHFCLVLELYQQGTAGSAVMAGSVSDMGNLSTVML